MTSDRPSPRARWPYGPGMNQWGLVRGSFGHVAACHWKYGNSFTNSKEIVAALGLDPDAPFTPVAARIADLVEMGKRSQAMVVALRDERDHALARITELERAVRMFLTEIDESHQPQWVSEEAKAAGKEPWVCVTCGTADGSWPCGERLSLDELKAALGEVRHDQ
jgi:hypothetical protein